MAKGSQFLLLLWKFALYHKWAIKMSIFKILMPLFFLLSFAILMGQVPRSLQRVPKSPEEIYEPESPFDKKFWAYSVNTLAFIPNKPLYYDLLRNALRDINSTITLKGFPNQASWDSFYKNYTLNYESYILALVTFDVTASPLDQLKFTLRLPTSSSEVHTDKAYPPYSVKPQFIFPNYSDFASLQAAISLAFIKKQDVSATFDVKFQRMPYPAYPQVQEEMAVVLNDISSMIIVFGLIILVPITVKMVVHEKSIQAKEMMKMMGMSDLNYWLATFTGHFIIIGFIGIATTVFFFIPFGSVAYINSCRGEIFLIFILAFCVSTVLFCLTIATICPRTTLAVFFGLLFWVASYVPAMALYFMGTLSDHPMSTKLFSCLLPPLALHLGLKIIFGFETYGEMLDWSNITRNAELDESFSLGHVIGMMILSWFIYGILIWYFDKAWPWQPAGAPRPLYFCFQDCFSKLKFKEYQNLETLDVEHSNFYDDKFFEPIEHDKPRGIEIINLTKEFKAGQRAVDHANLNIYSGEVTALLGHNGAGKTTTMNMITGLLAPTSGRVQVNGHDVFKESSLARKSLGLCPQHNVLYDFMTVEQHLLFFAGLKGQKKADTSREIEDLLGKLNMLDKLKSYPPSISGGMKRKLSLAIALIGGSEVVILDEPTSGMDPEARRNVWDMILGMRRARTILLTTHYMEEADALGDRIAIMAQGQIYCAGSSLFLKKTFGAGYHLRVAFATEQQGNSRTVQDLNTLIKSHVPSSQMERLYLTEATFALGNVTTAQMINLFASLEKVKDSMGLSSFGATVTTLEDVFLKVGEYVEETLNPSKNASTNELVNSDSNGEAGNLSTFKKITPIIGPQLWIQWIKSLLLKRFHYHKRHYILLLFQFVLPALFSSLIVLTIYQMMNTQRSFNSPPKLDLKLEPFYKNSKSFYASNITHDKLRNSYRYVAEREHASYTFFKEDPNNYLLERGNKNLRNYKEKWLVGASSQEDSETKRSLLAWYNGYPYHALPISVNFLMNALLRMVSGKETAFINVSNWPLPRSDTSVSTPLELTIALKFTASIFLALGLTFLSASMVLLPIHENEAKAKLLQLMAGIPGWLFWLINFLYDFAIYTFCSFLILGFFALVDSSRILIPDFASIGPLFVLFFFSGWAIIPFTYLFSFAFSKSVSGFAYLSTIYNAVAIILSITVRIMELVELGMPSNRSAISAWVFRLLPPFAITNGMTNVLVMNLESSACRRFTNAELLDFCQNSDSTTLVGSTCCASCTKESCHHLNPYSLHQKACGSDLLMMAIMGFIYLALLFLIESNFFNWLCYRMMALYRRLFPLHIVPQSSRPLEGDVLAEQEKIHDLVATSQPSLLVNSDGEVRVQMNSWGDHRLVVSDLTKVFRRFTAVDHLSFGVYKQEFFGLLGVNGAGKTTTFRMLTGDLLLTEGNAYIGPFDVRSNLKKYQRYIGYCPQYDPLLDRLTGREQLTLFARIRGIPEPYISQIVTQLLEEIDITAYADKVSSSYSGGTKRKLALGLAIIGWPPLVFLDEPTSGVDPASRRKIWNALGKFKKLGDMSFILTSHSMEEVEALCSRAAIMVKGQFRCLGSMQRIKGKFGKGFNIVTKLQQDATPNQLAEVESFLRNHFPTLTIKDSHEGHVEFEIRDPSTSWKTLFEVVDQAKQRFNLEDYFISDSSLEQIFLSFAREQ